MARSAIVWFDLPVTDMERARRFYAEVLGAEVPLMEGSDGRVALFPMDPDGEVGGDLALADEPAQGLTTVPGTQGATVYFDGGPDLQIVLDRVEPAGGKVLQPKAFMGEQIGYFAFFLDCEGIRVGVHSRA